MTAKETKTLVENLYHYISLGVWCEECSTDEHPIQMEEIEGVYFQCPLCKKKVMILPHILFNVGSHYSTSCKRCKELEKKGIVFGKKEVK